MDTTTQKVIEFLSHPELPFGSEEDVRLLDDPDALRDRVAALLDEFPALLGEEASADLKTHLDEAAWSFIALEMETRFEATAGFSENETQNFDHSL
ncbi:MAG TPA: hypothetical protein VF627_15380 [Abditibacterium sp.]|jgi:hypothetical protein